MSVYTEEAVEVAAPPKERVVTEQDVLDRAADLLEEFGWCQNALALDEEDRGIFGRDDPWNSPRATQFCVVGAIFRARTDLGVELPHVCPPMVDWNNNHRTTKDEVVLALRAGLPQFRNK